jgi:hypothetical protein
LRNESCVTCLVGQTKVPPFPKGTVMCGGADCDHLDVLFVLPEYAPRRISSITTAVNSDFVQVQTDQL